RKLQSDDDSDFDEQPAPKKRRTKAKDKPPSVIEFDGIQAQVVYDAVDSKYDPADEEEQIKAGEIHVALKSGLPYANWNIRQLARSCGLVTRISHPFNLDAYPGYEHRRTLGFKHGVSKDGNAEIANKEPKTHVFCAQADDAQDEKPKDKKAKAQRMSGTTDMAPGRKAAAKPAPKKSTAPAPKPVAVKKAAPAKKAAPEKKEAPVKKAAPEKKAAPAKAAKKSAKKIEEPIPESSESEEEEETIYEEMSDSEADASDNNSDADNDEEDAASNASDDEVDEAALLAGLQGSDSEMSSSDSEDDAFTSNQSKIDLDEDAHSKIHARLRKLAPSTTPG
ncbi:hypothetical protein LPJ62_006191, partial [Coemansia sp. RSA 2167]